jgi:hypothetical protein
VNITPDDLGIRYRALLSSYNSTDCIGEALNQFFFDGLENTEVIALKINGVVEKIK